MLSLKNCLSCVGWPRKDATASESERRFSRQRTFQATANRHEQMAEQIFGGVEPVVKRQALLHNLISSFDKVAQERWRSTDLLAYRQAARRDNALAMAARNLALRPDISALHGELCVRIVQARFRARRARRHHTYLPRAGERDGGVGLTRGKEVIKPIPNYGWLDVTFYSAVLACAVAGFYKAAAALLFGGLWLRLPYALGWLASLLITKFATHGYRISFRAIHLSPSLERTHVHTTKHGKGKP